MFRRLLNCLKDFWLDLVLNWHAYCADPAPDPEPRIGPFRFVIEDDDGEEIAGVDCIQAHCCNCGHHGPAPLIGGQNADNIVDMLECPVCGLYLMCSD